jgi:hypothetical protein
MIKFPYIILLFAIGIFFITENNYFNIISNNDFTNMITNNSTLYKVHDKLCLLNYTDFLANSHYYCANYIEPVVQKINITNNKVLSLNYNTHEFFSFWNIFIILSIYTLYNFLSNLKKM